MTSRVAFVWRSKFSLRDCPKILLHLFEEDTLLFLLVGKLWLKTVYEEVIFVSEICPMSRSGVQRRGRGPMARSRVQCHGRGSNVAVAGQHTDALLSSHFPIVKGISAAKDFTLNDNRLKQLPKYAFRCLLPRKGRGGGYSGCSTDRDHQMGG